MSEENRIKVWDIGVRIFHWSLVALLFLLYFSFDEESRRHIQAGYAVLGLIVLRVVWGFIGTKHARFGDFIHGPGTVSRYARSLVSGKPLLYLGHNPLAGLMVLALLISVFITAWSGLELYGSEGRGPLANGSIISTGFFSTAAYADDDDEGGRENGEGRGERGERGEHYWENIHDTFAGITLNLIYIHILAGIVMSFIYRENLIKSMVTGYKVRRKE